MQMGELLQSLIANRPLVVDTAKPQRGESSQREHDTEEVQEPNAAGRGRCRPDMSRHMASFACLDGHE